MSRVVLTSVLLVLAGSLTVLGQQQTPVIILPPAPPPVIINRMPDDDMRRPLTIRESLEKMRIEKDKKDFDQMIARGSEVLRMTEEIETAYAQHGKLSQGEYSKIASVEKLVKKIRDELGGDDDDSDKEEAELRKSRMMSAADAIKGLKDSTIAMMDELKKTTRFSISAAAIQTSNAVLRLARFLKVTN